MAEIDFSLTKRGTCGDGESILLPSGSEKGQGWIFEPPVKSDINSLHAPEPLIT